MERGEPYELELRLRSAEDQLKWVRTNGEPVREDGEIVAIRGAIQDITDLKERERELERYRVTTQAANNTIITIDESSTIRSVNPAVEDTFGYEPEELVGKKLTVLMSEETAKQHRQTFQRYLQLGERTVDWNYVELPGQHRDGTSIPLAVSFGEATFEGERFFVGTIREITDRE
jgi:PAS domain S-box-containing protein